MSLDGFTAGADQSLQDPLGVGGEQLRSWMFSADEPGHEVLGAGERPFDGVTEVSFEPFEAAQTPWASHVRYRVRR